MRTFRPHLAILAIAGAIAAFSPTAASAAAPTAQLPSRPSPRPVARVAQQPETMMEETGMAAAMDGAPAAGCGCNNVQRPPWHGNVQGEGCGSACGAPCATGCGGHVFQAKPCHQLHLRGYARANCMTLPPCFPRFHTWCTEGYLPSPQGPSLPRCHQCGAVIDGGF